MLHKRIFQDFNVPTICSEAAEHCEGMIGRATRHACTPQVGIGPAAGNLGEGQPQIGIVFMGVVAHHIEAVGRALPPLHQRELGRHPTQRRPRQLERARLRQGSPIQRLRRKDAPYTRCKQGIKPAVDCNDGRAIFRRTPQSIARRGFGRPPTSRTRCVMSALPHQGRGCHPHERKPGIPRCVLAKAP